MPTPEPVSAEGPNWSAYLSPLDIARAIERLRAGERVGEDLLSPGILILARDAAGALSSYELDADQLGELRRPDSEIASALAAAVN